MTLNDMTIGEKIAKLKSSLDKANQDINYSEQVKWGDDMIRAKAEMEVLIDTSKSILLSGNSDAAEVSAQEEMYADYNRILDSCLKKFPEYSLGEEQNVFAKHQ